VNLAQLRELIPDFARDTRLNLDSVLNSENDLTPQQSWGTALACAYALKDQVLVNTIRTEGTAVLDDAVDKAARGAATIMAMNNVYYRSTHLMADEGLKKLPAKLRMNVIGSPGIAKVDFELMCFAVSALSGCGQCLTSHLHELRKANLGDVAVQSSLRIASVLNAANSALAIREI
jgi:alkyl hydroperoxide reductase subunit D